MNMKYPCQRRKWVISYHNLYLQAYIKIIYHQPASTMHDGKTKGNLSIFVLFFTDRSIFWWKSIKLSKNYGLKVTDFKIFYFIQLMKQYAIVNYWALCLMKVTILSLYIFVSFGLLGLSMTSTVKTSWLFHGTSCWAGLLHSCPKTSNFCQTKLSTIICCFLLAYLITVVGWIHRCIYV